MGRRACVVAADQRSVPAIEAACARAADELGPVTLLANSAAIWPSVDVTAATQEDFDLALEVNLRGPFFWARYLGAEMKRRGRGASAAWASAALWPCAPVSRL